MTPGLLTVVSNKIARAFISSGATPAVARDIFKGFRKSLACWSRSQTYVYGISGQIFGLASSFLGNRRLQVVLAGKSSQACLVNTRVS